MPTGNPRGKQPLAKPAKPTISSTRNTGEVAVSWRSVPHARFYTIGWANQEEAQDLLKYGHEWLDAVHYVTVPAQYRSHTIRDLKLDGNYIFVVGAADTRFDGPEPSWSPWSDPVRIGQPLKTTSPSAPKARGKKITFTALAVIGTLLIAGIIWSAADGTRGTPTHTTPQSAYQPPAPTLEALVLPPTTAPPLPAPWIPAALNATVPPTAQRAFTRNAPTRQSAIIAEPTAAPAFTTAATRYPAPTPAPVLTQRIDQHTPPDERHLEAKQYMLGLINAERQRAGLNPVTLGTNTAAQIHAENALAGCFGSHWGLDGLKPYMRYSLAGGYQSNGENWHGSDYCITASDGYSAAGNVESRIRTAMDGWMRSEGHRQNILRPHHKQVNIGIAWDTYNTTMLQHFEGDYVNYDRKPSISNGVLSLSGSTKNSASFNNSRDMGVQIYYDPPPYELTRGQVSRTYCYGSGRPVAGLREPLIDGRQWTKDWFDTMYKQCPDPYDVPASAAPAGSNEEAHQLWQEAYNASQSRVPRSITVPWITASEWTASGTSFSLRADISEVLNMYGNGVYSLMVWGNINNERTVISQYSVFHGVTPPDTYERSGKYNQT